MSAESELWLLAGWNPERPHFLFVLALFLKIPHILLYLSSTYSKQEDHLENNWALGNSQRFLGKGPSPPRLSLTGQRGSMGDTEPHGTGLGEGLTDVHSGTGVRSSPLTLLPLLVLSPSSSSTSSFRLPLFLISLPSPPFSSSSSSSALSPSSPLSSRSSFIY